MAGPQQVIDIDIGRLRQAQRLSWHHHHLAPHHGLDPDAADVSLRYWVESLPSGNSGVCL